MFFAWKKEDSISDEQNYSIYIKKYIVPIRSRVFFGRNCTYYSIKPKSPRERFYIFLIKPTKKIVQIKKKTLLLTGTIVKFNLYGTLLKQ